VAHLGDKVEVGGSGNALTEVRLRGQLVERRSQRHVTVMLNKPRGYVTTMSDEFGRPCVAELVSDVGVRVYPCGRLDYDSEGLLILTSDGDLCHKLTHPSFEIPKTYIVKLGKAVTPEQLAALNRPMEVDGERYKAARAEIVTLRKNETVLRMTLREGRNRQIRKMCESLGLNVLTLKRVAIGSLELGNLKPGKWRKLTPTQIAYLKKGKN
jgi:23S rRNA pseudouridine2605 synthase